MKYYFVGIKGSGLSSISQVLYDLGHEVAGADINQEMFTQKQLENKNIKIDSLDNMNYHDSDIIVVGNAFLDKYDFKDKTVITYQDLLSQLNDMFYSIAICGTHGKTTTTNMIKHVLGKFYDINYLVGDGHGKGNKEAKIFIYEACEHRDHFLSYHPNIIVCTNIDYDHVEYFDNKEQYLSSFTQFFSNCKETLILNEDINHKSSNSFSYGTKQAQLLANNIKYSENGTYFDLKYNKQTFENIFLPLFGKHMLEDALATIACCLKLNLTIQEIINQLKTYKHASRRYNTQIIKNNVIIDDYGHHPKEIISTIEAIKQQFNDKDLVIIFHPDRPKRLLTFLSDYKVAFNKSKQTYIMPFLNKGDEESYAISKIIDNDKIIEISEGLYNKLYNNCVFLFTGSKEMKKEIEKLKRVLNNI